MGHYGFRKKGENSRLVVRPMKSKPAAVVAPLEGQTVSLEGNTKKVHACTLCEAKIFPKPGLVAAHFARMHNDLVEDKNTWRRYHEVREVQIDANS